MRHMEFCGKHFTPTMKSWVPKNGEFILNHSVVFPVIHTDEQQYVLDIPRHITSNYYFPAGIDGEYAIYTCTLQQTVHECIYLCIDNHPVYHGFFVRLYDVYRNL